MEEQTLNVKTVAVIGAGVSGVSAAVHLKRAGLQITVFERSSRAGGVWVYDNRTSLDPKYPAVLPSQGDSPEYESFLHGRHDSPVGTPVPEDAPGKVNTSLSFAPPGPAYEALRNNVSTTEMELSCQKWKPGTEDFVPHNVLAEYIQDVARENGVSRLISFNTRVDHVEKVENKWRVDISKFDPDQNESIVQETQHFDAMVVANGHYHAFNIPDIPGLRNWKAAFPSQVQHSKLYRRPETFRGKNVLLVGSGVSSMDIARDLGPYAKAIFQSSRGGPYDLPSHLLPEDAARIGGIERFDELEAEDLAANGGIPGTVTLSSGQKLQNIHHVIVCTGYHVSFPFMRQHHRDGVSPEDADEECLVTNGQVTHNLHKDIWYIDDPSLAFIGVPYHVATFSLFEFQAMAVAQVLAGKVALPGGEVMREEYKERVGRKGAGRTLHSFKGKGEEVRYVQDLVDMVNRNEVLMKGHSQKWLAAYERRCQRQAELFAKVQNPEMNERILIDSGCLI